MFSSSHSIGKRLDWEVSLLVPLAANSDVVFCNLPRRRATSASNDALSIYHFTM